MRSESEPNLLRLSSEFRARVLKLERRAHGHPTWCYSNASAVLVQLRVSWILRIDLQIYEAL